MSQLTLTVLGSSRAWPNPDGACSGYLVSTANTHILLECGPGVVGRLRAQLDVRHLTAVVVSHMHADHFLDLVPLRYGLKYGRLAGDRALPVHLPPDGMAMLAAIGRALDNDERFFTDTFALTEYDPSEPTRFGPVTIELRRVLHYVPSYAMRISAAGRVLVFSADAAPCDALVEHARSADVLLAENAIDDPSQDSPQPERRGHLTAYEAGLIAARAGAKRLLLTHGHSDAADPDHGVAAARQAFGGPVERVRDGRRYVV